MTPKEKAQELINQYISLTNGWVHGINGWEHKKKCALIVAQEIREEVRDYGDYNHCQDRMIFWGDVIDELKKI